MQVGRWGQTLLGLIALCVWSGCALATTEPANESDIQGGAVERARPAVGMVRLVNGNFGTGVLIRPNVVLTAGHVAERELSGFYFGTPPAGKEPTMENLEHVAVAEQILGSCYASGGFPKAGCAENVDVGLLRLAEDVASVQPAPMYLGSLDEVAPVLRSASLVAVGFGCYTVPESGAQTWGTRRSAISTFRALGSVELATRPATGIATSGDSGGPLFFNGMIIGTVRGGLPVAGNSCGRSEEYYVRIDRVRDWIQTRLAAWGVL